MATHYNNFEVSFHKQYNNEVNYLNFYEDLKSIDYEKIVEIEENSIIYLRFPAALTLPCMTLWLRYEVLR